jgi:TetR/AcrR family transcriptional regulator, acrAB operon repressor
MARRTKEEAAATRERILDAAAQVFVEHGVMRASLEEVAEAARVTRGAVYFHFKDKCALFQALMDRSPFPVDAVHHATRVTTDHADPLTRIERQLVQVLRLASTDPAMRRTVEIVCEKVEYVDELLPLRRRVQHTRETWVQDIERELDAAASLGLITPHLPRHALALGLAAQVEGLIRSWLVDPAFDLVQVGRQVLRLQLQAMRKDVPGQPVRPRDG